MTWGAAPRQKVLSGGNKNISSEQERTQTEDIVISSIIFLAEGGVIQRWRIKFNHLTAAAPPLLLLRETGPFYSYFCQDLCKQQLDAGSPPVYKVQWHRLLIQFSPLQIKMNITSGSFHLTHTVLWHALPLAQCQQNKILAVSRLMLRMTLFFKPKSYLYKVCHKRHCFYLSVVQSDQAAVS